MWAWQVTFPLPSTDEHTITTTMPIGQPCSTYLNILNKRVLIENRTDFLIIHENTRTGTRPHTPTRALPVTPAHPLRTCPFRRYATLQTHCAATVLGWPWPGLDTDSGHTRPTTPYGGCPAPLIGVRTSQISTKIYGWHV